MSRKSSRRRRHSRLKPGSSPGMLTVDPGAPRPVVRLLGYGPEGLIEEDNVDPDRIQAVTGQQPVTWINVDGVGNPDLMMKLGDLFGLHRLALEDVINVQQRSKVEDYGDYTFVVARMTTPTPDLDTEQLSIFLGAAWVLTFQEKSGDCLDPVRERIREGRPRIRASGSDYLAYAILDAVVDAYFPVLDACGDRLEALEEEIVNDSAQEVLFRLHQVKREMIFLTRIGRSLRDALMALSRPDTPHITDTTRVYLRDCLDHAIRLVEQADTYRETATSLMDLYLSRVSQRMNEIMKVLTIVATIFIPLTFIAGIYGMNFAGMPELRARWGYPAVLALMAAVGLFMVGYFIRKGWIGSRRKG